jgi:UDP-N-acetyl-2-amino-2-deoxyglucuronate dehydrogenase
MNFAIIGCGFISIKHAETIKKISGSKIVAVCDKNPAAMKRYEIEFGATAYTNIEEMLASENIDIVNICTPSGSHANIAELAAFYGKHIIVEKPMALSLEDTDRIIQASKVNNVKLAVVHPNRFRPAVMRLHEIIQEGHLGKISHALCVVNWNRGQHYYDQAPWRGTKEQDGGVLMNQAIHNLDLLLSFMGTPTEVFSMEATRLRDIEVEDVSTGVIRFESGALATVQASTTVYPQNYEESLTIFGEKGTVKIGGEHALYFKTLEAENLTEEEIERTITEVESNPWGTPGHERIIRDMIEAISEDRAPVISGDDGRNAVEIVLAFYESAQKNRPVKLGERGEPNDKNKSKTTKTYKAVRV